LELACADEDAIGKSAAGVDGDTHELVILPYGGLFRWAGVSVGMSACRHLRNCRRVDNCARCDGD
jgi:hypothetical protein